MERGSKRKAAAAASPDADARATKRLKSPNGPINTSTGETTEATTKRGLQFITALKALKDKSGREIIGEFLELPDKKFLPEYYAQIKLPISIETIETKLNGRGYSSLSALESDVKRMISNAKQFNEPRSEIYQDAERIRKSTSNWMTKANPAYSDPNYQAIPTPLPEESGVDGATVNGRARSATKGTSPSRSARSTSAVVLNGSASAEDGAFAKKTFQQAQLQIVDELINYEEDGLAIFTVFLNLPSRELEDYYRIIKQPMSLNGIRKRVRGVHGRHGPTNSTDFKSWDSFESEVGKIWQNARTYNEDGSEIFELASLFEELFKSKLADAKKSVDEPPQPSLKLYSSISKPTPTPTGLKLNLSQKPSPSPQLSTKGSSPAPLSGTKTSSVDSSALNRQHQPAQPTLNGIHTSTIHGRGTTDRSPTTGVEAVKAEAKHSQSPHINNSIPARPLSSANQHSSTPSMLPPPPRVSSGSPHPQSFGYVAPPYIPPPVQPPPTGFDNRFRPEGKDATTALMQNLQLASHPSLLVPKPYKFNVRPNDELSQHSVTLNVPSSLYYMQLKPTYLTSLTTAMTDGTPPRPYKMFVTVNGMRVQPTRMQVPEGQQVVYDLKLAMGVNRVEVECVAEKTREDKESLMREKEKEREKGNVKVADAQLENLEMEKCNIFVNLMRNVA